MQLTKEDLDEFKSLRAWTFELIAKALEEDGHCKSYEGTWSIRFPNYFENKNDREPGVTISLDCYVLGPSRHYEWWDKTFLGVVKKARAEIEQWEREKALDEMRP